MSGVQAMERRPAGQDYAGALSRALLARSGSSDGIATGGSSPRSISDVQVPFAGDDFARRDLEIERARLEGDRAAFELERARTRAANAQPAVAVVVRDSRSCCGRFCESIYDSWCFKNFAAPAMGFGMGVLSATAAWAYTQPDCKGPKSQ